MNIRRVIILGVLLPFCSFMQGQVERVATASLRTNAQQEQAEIQRKAKEVKTLVVNAAKHFNAVLLDTACKDFIYDSKWRKGELFVFVFDSTGVCLAHGDDSELIWKSIAGTKGIGGKRPLIKDMLSVGRKGGRLSYLWDNAFKSSYLKVVNKNGIDYVIGSGFYPESDEYSTEELVKMAVAYFNQNGKEATFALINNPTGPFVKGDIYMFAYDFKGICVAHGNNAALVGQNLIDQVDSRGKAITKALITTARTRKGSGWVDYTWLNDYKRAYVERVVDPKTKKPYLISAGYYPNINLATTKTFVNRAITHLKAVGARAAFQDFSSQAGNFIRGGLTIFVYNFEGKCLANGGNPGFVGQNLIKHTDQEGKLYVQEIIERARKDGKALVSLMAQNTHELAYVERIDVPDGKFVIGATYHPDSKAQSVRALVDKAIDYLRDIHNSKEQAFGIFSNKDSEFYRGDLQIFVYDAKGTRLVNGTHMGQIWRNFLKTPDEAGKPIVADIIATGVNGGGWLEYVVRNARRRVYVKSIEKPTAFGSPQLLVVGSGYFL
ncbi:cache domain-containing protein [Candidatus Dependentiae bacterium]|nr:cache domain-containing protein [Candidatus Dependentiae bacterium]